MAVKCCWLDDPQRMLLLQLEVVPYTYYCSTDATISSPPFPNAPIHEAGRNA